MKTARHGVRPRGGVVVSCRGCGVAAHLTNPPDPFYHSDASGIKAARKARNKGGRTHPSRSLGVEGRCACHVTAPQRRQLSLQATSMGSDWDEPVWERSCHVTQLRPTQTAWLACTSSPRLGDASGFRTWPCLDDQLGHSHGPVTPRALPKQCYTILKFADRCSTMPLLRPHLKDQLRRAAWVRPRQRALRQLGADLRSSGCTRGHRLHE